MEPAELRRRFRAILAGSTCVNPASVFDPVSARIAGDLGYEAMMLAGSVASMAVLGAPDIAVLTLTELAEQVRRICRVATLPLLVDADHGYGNAFNVMRTIAELESAGAAALTIEDTLLPRPFGGSDGVQLIPLDEGIGKMRAAIAGRRDKNLVVVGRTSAAAVNLEEAIMRTKAYTETGIDALFLSGVKSVEHVEAIASATRLPLILGSLPAPNPSREYLTARGVRICLQGNQTFPAAMHAVYQTMKALKDGVPAGKLDGIADAQTMSRLTAAQDYALWGRQFLGADA